jgi:sensor histidine kinase YesM
MHPIFAERERFLLYMAVWLVVAALLCLLVVVMNGFAWNESVALLLPMVLVYAFMCLAPLYVCRAFPLLQTSFLKMSAIVIAASLLSAATWTAIGKAIALLLSNSGYLPLLSDKFDAAFPLLFGIGALLFSFSVVVHYLLLAFDATRAAERTSLQLEVLAREAELKALRSQIQPHFLFNSLNSISALTTTNAHAARAMSLKLAEFFRTTLKLGQEPFISLAEELQLTEIFLSIEQVRFGSRLSFRKNLESGCESIQVPSLILQPLVENAVNHGVAHLVEGGTIELSARKNGNVLMLSVSNPCDADRPQSKSTGMGLANVRRRLAGLYGNDARLTVANETQRFNVELVIPLR